MNNSAATCVQYYAMSESTFPIEFIGGSRDGEIIEAAVVVSHVMHAEVKDFLSCQPATFLHSNWRILHNAYITQRKV